MAAGVVTQNGHVVHRGRLHQADLHTNKQVRVSEDHIWNPGREIRFAKRDFAEDRDYTWNLSRGIHFSFAQNPTTTRITRDVSRDADFPTPTAVALNPMSSNRLGLQIQRPRFASTNRKKSGIPPPLAYNSPSATSGAGTPAVSTRKNSKIGIDYEGQMLENLGYKPKVVQKSESTQRQTAENASIVSVEKATGKRAEAKATTVNITKAVTPVHEQRGSISRQSDSSRKATGPTHKSLAQGDVIKHVKKPIKVDHPPSEAALQALPSIQLKSYSERQIAAGRKELVLRYKLEHEEEAEFREELKQRESRALELRAWETEDYEQWEMSYGRPLDEQPRICGRSYEELQDMFSFTLDSWLDVARSVRDLRDYHSRLDQASQGEPMSRMSRSLQQRLYWQCQHDNLLTAGYTFGWIGHEYRGSVRDRLNLTVSSPNSHSPSLVPRNIRGPNEPFLRAQLATAASHALLFSAQEVIGDFRLLGQWRAVDVFGSRVAQMKIDLIDRVGKIMHVTNGAKPWERVEHGGPGFEAHPVPKFTNPLRLEVLGSERFIRCWHEAEIFFCEVLWLHAHVTGRSGLINRLELSLLESPNTPRRQDKLQIYYLIDELARLSSSAAALKRWNRRFLADGVFLAATGKSLSWALSDLLARLKVFLQNGGSLWRHTHEIINHLRQRTERPLTAEPPIAPAFKRKLHQIWQEKFVQSQRSDFDTSVANSQKYRRLTRFWWNELGKLPQTPSIVQARSKWLLLLDRRRSRLRGTTDDIAAQSKHKPSSKRRITASRPRKPAKSGSKPNPGLSSSNSVANIKIRRVSSGKGATNRGPTTRYRGHLFTTDTASRPRKRTQRIEAGRDAERAGEKERSTRDSKKRTRQAGKRKGQSSTAKNSHNARPDQKATRLTQETSSRSNSVSGNIVSRRRRSITQQHSGPETTISFSSVKRPILRLSSGTPSDKSNYYTSAIPQVHGCPAQHGITNPTLCCVSDDKLDDERTLFSSVASGGKSPSQSDSPDDCAAEDPEDHGLGQLVYRIPENDMSRDVAAYKSGKEHYWSHLRYRGPDGRSPSVRYCTTLQQSEEVAQIFALEKVIGFDMEWKIGGSSIKEHVSVMQIACDATIAVFHLSLYKGDGVDDMIGPKLKELLQSPNILKSGVNIGADFKRVWKYLGLKFEGCFELSRLHNLVTLPDYGRKPSKRLVSLSKQVEHHLLLPLRKDEVRTSDWSKRLNYEQVKYAAADAYASFRLFHDLEAKRLSLDPIPPRPETVDANLRVPVANELEQAADTIQVDASDVDADSHSELHRSALSAEEETPVLSEGDLLGVKTATNIPVPKQQRREESTIYNGSDTEVSVSVSGEPHPTRAEEHVSRGLIAYPDLTARLQSLGIEEAITVTTQYNEARAAMTVQLSSADAWAEDWMRRLPEGTKRKSRHRQLQAYALWHQQGMSIRNIAATLKSPPLSPNTVTSYILDVIRDEELPFDTARLRDMLPNLHQTWVSRRYWSLLQRLE
ncbi:MAG: hypothetical protein Q9165_004775 [Trypethelium subeluteriae]